MSGIRKALCLIAIAIAAWLTPAGDATADVFDCWNGGQCLYQAGCSGSWASGYCEIDCWDQVPCECDPNTGFGCSGTCYSRVGGANCFYPT